MTTDKSSQNSRDEVHSIIWPERVWVAKRHMIFGFFSRKHRL